MCLDTITEALLTSSLVVIAKGDGRFAGQETQRLLQSSEIKNGDHMQKQGAGVGCHVEEISGRGRARAEGRERIRFKGIGVGQVQGSWASTPFELYWTRKASAPASCLFRAKCTRLLQSGVRAAVKRTGVRNSSR